MSFGVVMGSFYGIVKYDLGAGLTSGLLFGFFMSLTIGTVQKLKVRKLVDGPDGDVSPSQSATYTTQEPYKVIRKRCLDALGRIEAKIIKDDNNGPIIAKTRLSWKSFGEKIEVQLLEGENSEIKVVVKSNPIVKTTVLDYGKGLQNINSFMSFLNA